jgi:hypothetical protein
MSNPLATGIDQDPPDVWTNDGSHNQDLARFVIEGAEFVETVVSGAERELRTITDEQYRSFADVVAVGSDQGLGLAVKALYVHLLRNYNFRYAHERDFDPAGNRQQIRLPEDVHRAGRGTCIDLTILLLSCLAHAKMCPLYVQTDGHALAGVWTVSNLPDDRNMLLSDAEVREGLNARRLLILESTGFVEGYPLRPNKMSFRDAVEEAGECLKKQIKFALDIKRAWQLYPDLKTWASSHRIQDDPPAVTIEITPDIKEIVDYARAHAGPSRSRPELTGENLMTFLDRASNLEELRPASACLGAEAVRIYQDLGPAGFRQQLSREALGPLGVAQTPCHRHEIAIRNLVSNRPPIPQYTLLPEAPLMQDQAGEFVFSDVLWFYYFCALGVAAAIVEDRPRAVARRPYVNPVHQLLATYVQQEGLSVAPVLMRWLDRAHPVTRTIPVARNFAAYVLGMIGASEASDALARGLDDPGEHVAMYCITSLGKLRSTRHLDGLVRRFKEEGNEMLRLLLSQAISNIVGEADYEL